MTKKQAYMGLLEQMEQKEWDGKAPLYSFTAKKYFYTYDEVYKYTQDHYTYAFNLQLVICEPVELRYVNTNCRKHDLLENGKLTYEVHKSLEELNQTIEEFGIVRWKPGKYAVK